MSEVRIITNGHERPFKYGHEVPAHVHDEYQHLDADERTDGWIHYRGAYSHLTDYMRTSDKDKWHGYHACSYYSGTLIRLLDDGEHYIIARYIG